MVKYDYKLFCKEYFEPIETITDTEIPCLDFADLPAFLLSL